MIDKQPKNSRNCPALSKAITAKECGMDRVSKIPCPVECEFHPFTLANAGALTGMEERLFKKLQKRVLNELRGDKARALNQAWHEAEDEVAYFLMVMQAVNATGEVEGPDFYDRWSREHFDGLNNDERTLINAQRTQRPALIQIKQVLNPQTMEALDLLEAEPKPITLVCDVELDPAMAGDTLLAWIYDAPLFTRLSGPAFELPEHESGNPLDALREMVNTLKGPVRADQIRHWLREHALDVYGLLVESEATDDEESEDDDEEAGVTVDDVLEAFDWSELPDFSKETMPKQRLIGEAQMNDRLESFLFHHPDAEQAVQWFEGAWPDIASGVDQMTEGVLSDEGFGVVLILLAKAAGVLHPNPPNNEGTDPLRFIWQLGNEMRAASKLIEDEAGEEAFETYLQTSPQPDVSQWLCGEASTFAEGEEAVFEEENLAVVFPIVKAAIWEMCHWPVA